MTIVSKIFCFICYSFFFPLENTALDLKLQVAILIVATAFKLLFKFDSLSSSPP